MTGRCGALASAAEITGSAGASDPPAAAEDPAPGEVSAPVEDVSPPPRSACADASGKKDKDGSVAAAEDPPSWTADVDFRRRRVCGEDSDSDPGGDSPLPPVSTPGASAWDSALPSSVRHWASV